MNKFKMLFFLFALLATNSFAMDGDALDTLERKILASVEKNADLSKQDLIDLEARYRLGFMHTVTGVFLNPQKNLGSFIDRLNALGKISLASLQQGYFSQGMALSKWMEILYQNIDRTSTLDADIKAQIKDAYYKHQLVVDLTNNYLAKKRAHKDLIGVVIYAKDHRSPIGKNLMDKLSVYLKGAAEIYTLLQQIIQPLKSETLNNNFDRSLVEAFPLKKDMVECLAKLSQEEFAQLFSDDDIADLANNEKDTFAFSLKSIVFKLWSEHNKQRITFSNKGVQLSNITDDLDNLSIVVGAFAELTPEMSSPSQAKGKPPVAKPKKSPPPVDKELNEKLFAEAIAVFANLPVTDNKLIARENITDGVTGKTIGFTMHFKNAGVKRPFTDAFQKSGVRGIIVETLTDDKINCKITFNPMIICSTQQSSQLSMLNDALSKLLAPPRTQTKQPNASPTPVESYCDSSRFSQTHDESKDLFSNCRRFNHSASYRPGSDTQPAAPKDPPARGTSRDEKKKGEKKAKGITNKPVTAAKSADDKKPEPVVLATPSTTKREDWRDIREAPSARPTKLAKPLDYHEQNEGGDEDIWHNEKLKNLFSLIEFAHGKLGSNADLYEAIFFIRLFGDAFTNFAVLTNKDFHLQNLFSNEEHEIFSEVNKLLAKISNNNIHPQLKYNIDILAKLIYKRFLPALAIWSSRLKDKNNNQTFLIDAQAIKTNIHDLIWVLSHNNNSKLRSGAYLELTAVLAKSAHQNIYTRAGIIAVTCAIPKLREIDELDIFEFLYIFDHANTDDINDKLQVFINAFSSTDMQVKKVLSADDI